MIHNFLHLAIEFDLFIEANFNKTKLKLSSSPLPGIDIDWEYPSQRNGQPEDKENFILMLEELKQVLKPYNKLIAIAVGATEKHASDSYVIPRVVEQVDFVNLMAYDLHGNHL